MFLIFSSFYLCEQTFIKMKYLNLNEKPLQTRCRLEQRCLNQITIQF